MQKQSYVTSLLCLLCDKAGLDSLLVCAIGSDCELGENNGRRRQQLDRSMRRRTRRVNWAARPRLLLESFPLESVRKGPELQPRTPVQTR